MKNVLVIEDSKAFSSLVVAHIENSKQYTTTVAYTKAEAEEILSSRANEFFVAIVDLTLPDAPRGEAVDSVLAYKIPVIIFTSQLSESLREDITNKGIADYTLKQGQHNLEYVANMVNRIYLNRFIKVMVVDDSLTSRKLMMRLLSIQQYQVSGVSSAEEALELLKNEPDFKIIITDCYMDGIDGFELSMKIRATHSKDELAIIGVSGQGGQALSARFIKSGANDFLLKPFIPEEFFCRVNLAADNLNLIKNLQDINDQNKFLLSMAAHDIRNPLGIISKGAQRLLSRLKLENRDNDILKMIDRNSANLLELLNSLLELSRLNSAQFSIQREPSELSKILLEQIENHQATAEEKQISILANTINNHRLNIDATLVRQVCDNLISNAIKYSPAGTQVTVVEKEIDDAIEVQIIDQGAGISKQEQALLFKPFHKLSTRPTAGESSTGLGLAICAKIIEAHGGEIGYHPNPEDGSIFYFRLSTAE